MSTLSLRKIKHDSSAVDNIALTSDGATGFGTTSPDGKVDIEVTSGVNLALTKTTGASLSFNDGTQTRAALQGLNGIDGLAIHTGSTWTERMRVDSAGRITTPYQPAFHACDGPNQTGANTTVAFTSITNNVGNCYSGSTYRFTAPIAGTYFFSTTFMNNSNTYSRFGLYKNSIVYDGNLFTIASTYARSTACWITPLAANDYVYIVNGINNDPGCDIHSGYRNFCGYLLG